MTKKKVISKKVTLKKAKQILEMNPGGKRKIDPKKVKALIKQIQENKNEFKSGLRTSNTIVHKYYDMGDPAVIKAWVEEKLHGNWQDYKKGQKIHSLITALYCAAGQIPDKKSGHPDQKYKFLLKFINGGTKDRKLTVDEIKAMENLTIGQIIKILLPFN